MTNHRLFRRNSLLLLLGILSVLLLLSPSPGSSSPLSADLTAPFTEDEAAHLLRRAGFAGTEQEIRHLAGMGREDAVDFLLFYEEVPFPENLPPFHEEDVLILERRLMGDLSDDDRESTYRLLSRVDEQHMDVLRAWWIRRMIETPRPLEEKMTLFWHGHFTSGYREVESSRLMLEQNRFLRDNSVGYFKILLRGISRDGAMLRYLDNARNVKSSPNENYARELMELFTLGEGNYTEKDIREAARAFTGWGSTLRGFEVSKRNHDSMSKTIFGARGRFDGDHVIALLLRHPQSSRYMAKRLWEFFAYRDPDPDLVASLARVARESRFHFRKVLRTIFLSDEFYSERARFAQIKSPVELVVGAVRLLEIDGFQPMGLYLACKEMGQDLFQPPNVKGWDGHKKWITSNTLLARYNFGDRVLHDKADTSGRHRYRGQTGGTRLPLVFTPYDPFPTLRAHELTTPAAIVRHYVRRMLQRDLPPDRFQVLLDHLQGEGKPFDVEAPDAAARIRSLVFLIMSMPEFQLN